MKIQFREMSRTANTYRMEHLAAGHVVKFYVGHGDNNTNDIVLFDDNSEEDARHFPYSIRLVVRHDYKTHAVTITPKVSQNFIKEFGNDGMRSVADLFIQKLMQKMSYR